MAALRIGELLVQEGLITASQLQQALTAQQIFGGRLGTNLVEHGFVSEEDLARLLGRQLGIRVVEPHELADVAPGVVATVAPEVARRHGVVPFRHDERRDRISVAIADPGNLQKVDEIQFALGRSVDFCICPEVMLAWALEKYYGVERTRRYIRLAGVADAELQLFQPQAPAAAASSTRGAAAGRVVPGTAGCAGTAVAAAPARIGAAVAAPGRELTRDAILARIVEAPSRQELVGQVMDVLTGWCGQLVFFAVRGNELVGWAGRGLPVANDALRAIRLPMEGNTPLHACLARCTHALLPRIDEPGLRALAEGVLFVDPARPAFLLPLLLNQRAFGLFLMADLDELDFPRHVPLLAEIMKRVTYRLQVYYLMEQVSAPIN